MDADYWTKVAGPKWAAWHEHMDRVLAPYAQTLGDDARLSGGQTLIDVGCGCGATTRMAQRLSPEATIIGLDVSPPMLEIAERLARSEFDTDPRPRFVHCDAATEPIAPRSVERIISRFGVMFFADPEAAFRHMGEWLTPTGRMVFVVWGAFRENRWLEDPLDVVSRHVPAQRPTPNAPGPMSLAAADRRQAVFSAAGLTIVEALPLDQPLRIEGSQTELFDFFSQRGPIATALGEAEAAPRARAEDALRRYVATIHDGAGAALPALALRITASR